MAGDQPCGLGRIDCGGSEAIGTELGPCRQLTLPDDELNAVAAAIRGAIEGDRYPHAPRLDPLRAALARLDTATANPDPLPKAAPPAKPDKRARR
jgi:hypothetical protein